MERCVLCHLQGALWDCPGGPTKLLLGTIHPGSWAWGLDPVPTDGDSAAVSSQAWQSLQSRDFVWSQQVLPPGALPRADTKHHPPQSGCELSSSTRAEGGAGQLLDGHTFAWMAPPLAEGGEKRRPGQPSPTVGSGAVCTMAWTPLLLVLLSHCTGRDWPRCPGAQFLSYSLPAPSPEKLPLVLPHH